MGNAGCQGLQDGGAQSAYEWAIWPPGPQDAIAWERVLRDRPDLAPALEGKLGVPFVTWLMGFPEGWCDVPGVTRRQQLEALGDAVIPVQAALAWELLSCKDSG